MSVSAVSCRGGITSQFLRIIELSKEDASIKVLAANALSALVLAGISFAGRDLSGIQVPGAILDGGNFSRVNLSNANLEGCSLQDAFLSDADLEGACMSGVEFGQLPSLDKGSHINHSALACSPTADRIAITDYDKIKILDPNKSGKFLVSLKGHKDFVTALAYSPGGDKIASGSTDKTVKIWDAYKGGKALLTLRGHDGSISAVEYSPSGDWIASSGGVWVPSFRRRKLFCAGSTDHQITDFSLRIWDANTGECVGIMGEYGVVARALAYSPNGAQLAAGNSNKTVVVRDVYEGKEHLVLIGHEDQVISVKYFPRGDKIVSGSSDGTIKVWDAYTGLEYITLTHDALVSVACSPEGDRVASGAESGTVKVWDICMGKALLTFRDGGGTVVYSADGSKIIARGRFSEIKAWKSDLSPPGHSLHNEPLHCADLFLYSSCGNVIESKGRGSLKKWDAHGGKLLSSSTGIKTDANIISHSSQGDRAAAYDLKKRVIEIWNVSTGEIAFDIEGNEHFLTVLSYSPDGGKIASGDEKGIIKIWDAYQGGEALLAIQAHRKDIGFLVFSPNGDRLISARRDSISWKPTVKGVIKVRSAYNGDLMFRLGGHKWFVTALIFSPDGERIASSGGVFDKGTLKVWDGNRGGEAFFTFKTEHALDVLAYSPDGDRIAGSNNFEGVRIWDIHGDSGVLFTISLHDHGVGALAYSPSGREIVSGENRGSIKVWRLKDGQGRDIPPYLVWGNNRTLSLAGAQVANARGLSEENRSLLKQLRAEGDPERPDSEEEGRQRGRLECCIA